MKEKTGNKFQEYQIRDLVKTYKDELNRVNVFGEEDLKHNYELFKIEQGNNDCFDFFFKRLISRAILIYNRVEIITLEQAEKETKLKNNGQGWQIPYNNKNWAYRKNVKTEPMKKFKAPIGYTDELRDKIYNLNNPKVIYRPELSPFKFCIKRKALHGTIG